MNVADQDWLILGLGKSGVAAACLLHSKGAKLTLWDGIDQPGFRHTCADLIMAGHDYQAGKALPEKRFAGTILSPGIPRNGAIAQKAMEQSDVLIGEVESASRWFDGKIIAITGTNGKSTTTQLVEMILTEAGLSAKACGNIGHPFSTVVQEQSTDIAVIEVSSFQLESLDQFRADTAVYLNLAADHLDRYPDLLAYGKAKENIFNRQRSEDVAVVQKELQLGQLKARRVEFSTRSENADYSIQHGWIMCRGRQIMEQATTKLLGHHNAENIMAALAVAEVFHVEESIAISAIQKYRPLPHRLEFVDMIEGIQFINDSKATNPDALMRALEGIEAPAVLIAGGKNKGFDFRPLAGVVGESCQRVILIGESQQELNAAWGDWVACELEETLEGAVQSAFANRRGIKTVLLSPGCASFDMFENFEDRGERFKQAVSNLKNQQQGE